MAAAQTAMCMAMSSSLKRSGIVDAAAIATQALLEPASSSSVTRTAASRTLPVSITRRASSSWTRAMLSLEKTKSRWEISCRGSSDVM